jgi:hypothetical protein
MAQKKSRQTFEKLKREQAVKEKRALKQERKKAAKLAKALGEPPADPYGDAEDAEPGMDAEDAEQPEQSDAEPGVNGPLTTG